MMDYDLQVPYLINKRLKPKKGKLFDTYWEFAFERQEIFFNRINNNHHPWTENKILNDYKFTNVYRLTDRVSQYLISNIISDFDDNVDEVNNQFFKIILFKIFNKIETWEYLSQKLGKINLNDFDFDFYDKLLSDSLKSKKSIYSAAYIMASGQSFFGFERKHQNHLKLIEKMISEDVPRKLKVSLSMREGYEILLSYHSIGEFLAYQFITDINYSNLTNYSEMEFVKAGPGAKDGISKCFENLGEYSFEDVICYMSDVQESEFERLGLNFRTLWGRPLQLIDCQNIFCEVDKYTRVAYPEISGSSNRKKIKQKFSFTEKEQIDYKLPKKWIN